MLYIELRSEYLNFRTKGIDIYFIILYLPSSFSKVKILRFSTTISVLVEKLILKGIENKIKIWKNRNFHIQSFFVKTILLFYYTYKTNNCR